MATSSNKTRVIISIKKENLHKLQKRYPTQVGQTSNTISEYIERLIEKDFKEDKEWKKYK